MLLPVLVLPKDISLRIVLIYFFSTESLFCFAEGSLFFYAALLCQRPKALPLESASFEKLDQTLKCYIF